MRSLIIHTLAALHPGEKRQFSKLVIYNILVSVTDIAGLAMLVLMIGVYTNAPLPAAVHLLPSWLLRKTSILPFSLLLIFFIIKNSLGYSVNRKQCRFMVSVACRISQGKLSHYLSGSYSNYTTKDSSIHIRETGYYPSEFCQHILNGLQQIITQSMLVVLAITAILIFNIKLFLLIFVILLPPVTAIFFRVRREAFQMSLRAKQSSEKSLQYLQEALSGYVESNLYHKAKFFLKRYSSCQYAFNKSISDYLVLNELPNRVIEIFALLGLLILIIYSERSSGSGTAPIVTISAFMAAAYKIIPGFVKIINISGQINAFEFTIKGIRVKDPGIPGAPVNTTGEIESVRFRDVGFRYGSKEVLRGINLDIGRGDFLGLSGPSGRGKSTLVNLILGFLTQDTGDILINGRPVGPVQIGHYRHHISYVKQQPFILHGPLWQNITLDDTRYDENRLRAALDVSGLSQVVDACSDGVDKLILENGRNISGGQRQRIALARAFYKEASLYVLDEPFSELDETSEQMLLRRLRCLSEDGKLIVLVSHNTRGLDYCNKIISMDDR